MKYILLTLMVFIYTMPLAMATGGESPYKATHQGKTVVELIDETFKEGNMQYKATHQGKTVVELIDKTSKKRNKQICLTNVGKGKTNEKPC